jgi:hypothetical protein
MAVSFNESRMLFVGWQDENKNLIELMPSAAPMNVTKIADHSNFSVVSCGERNQRIRIYYQTADHFKLREMCADRWYDGEFQAEYV